MRGLTADLAARQRALETEAESYEAMLVGAEAEAADEKRRSIGLEAQLKALSKLTRPAAKAEIAELTRELGKARTAARTAHDKAKSVGVEVQRLQTQAKQSSRAKLAADARAKGLEKQLAVADSTDLDRICSEREEALKAELDASEAACRRLTEDNARLQAENDELRKVKTQPYASFFCADGKSYRLPMLVICMRLMTLGVAPHNVEQVIKLGAEYVGVDFETRQRNLRATKTLPRSVHIEYPIPSASTCATLPDRMAVLAQAQLGCEIGSRQQRLKDEGKDAVRDFNAGGYSDGAMKRGNDFFACVINIPGVIKSRLVRLVAGRGGTAAAKINMLRESFDLVGNTMGNLMSGGMGSVLFGAELPHVVEMASVAIISAFCTDRCAAEKLAIVGADLVKVKTDEWAKILQARWERSGDVVGVRARLLSLTEVAVEIKASGSDMEYIDAYRLEATLSYVYSQMLAMRPPLIEESAAALILASHRATSACRPARARLRSQKAPRQST